MLLIVSLTESNSKLSFLRDVLAVTQPWLDVRGMIQLADLAGIILKAGGGGVSRWSLLGALPFKLLKLARPLSSRAAVKAEGGGGRGSEAA